MHYSIQEAARLLKLTESAVEGYIASGKIMADEVRGRLMVPDSALTDFLRGGDPREEDLGEPKQRTTVMESILERLTTLEARLEEISTLTQENQSLFHELREKESLLAVKDIEIEKLRRDLLYQKRILEKEAEDRRAAAEEQRDALERAHAERLAAEEARWTERLAHEQERFNLQLSQARRQEGFWGRLVKMLTWS